MNPSSRFYTYGDRGPRPLWEDGGRVFCRGWRPGADGRLTAEPAVRPTAEHPPPASLDRLAHEYGLKYELDGAWTARPLEFVRERGRSMRVLGDPAGEPRERLLGMPMEMAGFPRLVIGTAAAPGKADRGLVHKKLPKEPLMPFDFRCRMTVTAVGQTGDGDGESLR